MIRRTSLRHEALGTLALLIIVAGSLSGCVGPTRVEQGEATGPYRVSVKMDPPSLNPPQFATLTYGVTDAGTGKPVAQFERVWDAIMHNVVVSSDLSYFRHSFADNVLENEVSMLTYFPRTGTYNAYVLFKPAGADIQEQRTTITAGQSSAEQVELTESSRRSSGSVRVELLKPPELRAGEAAQLAFFVTERGSPVTGLWPMMGAPGHLWVLSQGGNDLVHLEGASESRRLLPEATATLGVTSTGTARPGGAPGTIQSPRATQTPVLSPAPTLDPALIQAFATITANPQPTLAPVQLTAQAAVLETPLVQPAVGYGPTVLFTHTFPQPGLYKLWLELQYRGQPLLLDYVVRVEP